jgi:hypothetical protein
MLRKKEAIHATGTRFKPRLVPEVASEENPSTNKEALKTIQYDVLVLF